MDIVEVKKSEGEIVTATIVDKQKTEPAPVQATIIQTESISNKTPIENASGKAVG